MRITSDGKKYRNEAELRDLVSRFKSSGQTGSEFCKLEGIGASSLYKWLKRYGEEPNGSFVEVSSLESSNMKVEVHHAIELELPHGIKLRIL